MADPIENENINDNVNENINKENINKNTNNLDPDECIENLDSDNDNDTRIHDTKQKLFNTPEQTTIMVILMIKNESRIIKRCIEKILTIADAICISDTGSTDNTLEILKEYLPTLAPLPTIVVNHQWKDFGHNRSLSFVAAQTFCKSLNWDPNYCYGFVLDADMNVVITDKFKKESLVHTGYTIAQKSHNLEHYNKRFLKLSHDWKCIGVTHEYWNNTNCDNTNSDNTKCEQLTTIYINDIGDGGCKDDKFIRDKRLLLQALVKEPNNARYMFYLAQTLENLREYQEAIQMYKCRISANGWYEEVWYSMYSISKIYFELKDYVEMEYWGLKAYNYNNYRAENIYLLTRAFRGISHHFKAWHYMRLGKSIAKPDNALFLEPYVYSRNFDYEKTILSYYVEYHKRAETLHELIEYYNKWNDRQCYLNMQHYAAQIKYNFIKLMSFDEIDGYVPTTISLLCYKNNMYLVNISYVNHQNQVNNLGFVTGNDIIRTRNFMTLLDADFNQCEPLKEMCININYPPINDSCIKGIEDIHLYQLDNNIKWIGRTSENSHDGYTTQIVGMYDLDNNCLTNGSLIIPPNVSVSATINNSDKKWIPFGSNEFIYSWHPFTIGHIDSQIDSHSDKTQFVITHSQQTPLFFKNVHGSTNVVKYLNALYCIVHIIYNNTAQQVYNHLVIRINELTKCIEAYTDPFYFFQNSIEQTSYLEIKNDVMYTIVSRTNMDPTLVSIDVAELRFHDL